MNVRMIYMLQEVIFCQFFTCTVTFILLLFSSAFVLDTLCTVDVIKPKEEKFDIWFVLFMTWFKILFPSPRSNGHSLIFSPNYFKIPGFLFCFCFAIVVVVSSILLWLLGFPLISSMSSQLPFAHLSAHVSSLLCPPNQRNNLCTAPVVLPNYPVISFTAITDLCKDPVLFFFLT